MRLWEWEWESGLSTIWTAGKSVEGHENGRRDDSFGLDM